MNDKEKKKMFEEAKQDKPDDVYKEDVFAVADVVYKEEDENGEFEICYTEDELIKKAESHKDFRYDKDTKTLYVKLNISKMGRVMAVPLKIPMDYKGINRKFIIAEREK